jgi:hypothetical protein
VDTERRGDRGWVWRRWATCACQHGRPRQRTDNEWTMASSHVRASHVLTTDRTILTCLLSLECLARSPTSRHTILLIHINKSECCSTWPCPLASHRCHRPQPRAWLAVLIARPWCGSLSSAATEKYRAFASPREVEWRDVGASQVAASNIGVLWARQSPVPAVHRLQCVHVHAIVLHGPT